MKLASRYAIALLLFGLTLGLTAQTAQPSQTAQPVQTAKPAPEFKSQKAGNSNQYSLQWRIIGTEVEIIMSAPTTGWIGVGFNPTLKMMGASIIIAYVKDGKVSISDDIGVAPGAHRPDTQVGGTSNVRLIAGKEENGRTEIDFAIPLNSGDKDDKVLKAGDDVTVIWAYGPNGADNFTTEHNAMGKFKIIL